MSTDPWWEVAAAIKSTMESITDIGVVVAGHTYVQEWSDFLELFTTEKDGEKLVRGWQIVEPAMGDGYVSELMTLGNEVEIEDTLGFFIRGFTEMGEDPETSQADFRNLAWETKRTLDAMVRFTLTDSGLSVPRSYPATGLRISPMLFSSIECWGCDMTKRVRIMRIETAI